MFGNGHRSLHFFHFFFAIGENGTGMYIYILSYVKSEKNRQLAKKRPSEINSFDMIIRFT